MKISGPGAVSNVSKTKGAGKSGGDGSFSKMLDSVGEEKEISGTGGIGKINAVNFINSVDSDGKGRRRELVEDADELLDELLKIRDAMLGGTLSAHGLRAVQARLEKFEANCDDLHLNEIIEEIKIRAAVELAKLGL